MAVMLRDGSTTEDPRLDRLISYDYRSKAYPIRSVARVSVARQARSYTWRMPSVLDQGPDGACVGFSFAHDALARPAEIAGVDFTYAKEQLYWPAQREDEWPGGSYPGADPFYEGTSVLAGVKRYQALGFCKSYHWAFGVTELALGVGYLGPAVLGVWWTEGMFDTDDKGFIHPTGAKMGGHAIICTGVSVPGRFFRLRNSWGPHWPHEGANGTVKVSWDDMAVLLGDQGEAVIPTSRVRLKTLPS